MGIDSPVAWKSVCGDRSSWKSVLMLGIPGQHVPLFKLLPTSLSPAMFSHTSCLEVEASALLFPSIFHVKTGKYFIGCWHSGFTGSANLFQEVVKFKACMFLLSLLLPSICFKLFLAVWFMNVLFFFFLPDRRNNIVKLISAAAYLKSIECFLLSFRKLFLGSAVSKLLAASLLQSRSLLSANA